MKPVIYFLAETAIYPFSRNISIFAGSAVKYGQKGYLTRCSGQLTRCAVFDANPQIIDIPSEAKIKNCLECQRHTGILSKKYKIPLLNFEEFISSSFLGEVAGVVKDALKDPILYEYEGIPVGKIAFKSVSLATKDDSLEFSGDRLALMAKCLATAIESCMITQNIIAELHPEAFIYGQEYCPEIASNWVCKKNDIKTSYHTASALNGYDYGRLRIYSEPYLHLFSKLRQAWKIHRNIFIDADSVESCWDDVFFRNYIKGNVHIYSPDKNSDPDSLYDKLGLDRNHKTLVLYTSSPDERKTTELFARLDGYPVTTADVFPDQILWLKRLCAYVSHREDLQLVIRMHPRLGLDQRSGIASPHLEEFKQALHDLPDRCRVIWPQDSVSSYDLAELADLVLVSWSTMGRELARIGIPVIATAQNLHYPDDDFIQIPASEEEYFNAVTQTLQRRYDFSTLARAIRFNYFFFELPTLDLREFIGSDLPDITQDPTLFLDEKHTQLLRDLFLCKFELLDYKLQLFEQESASRSEADETKAICRELCYFIHNTFYPPVGMESVPYLKKMLDDCKALIKQGLPQGVKQQIKNILETLSNTAPKPAPAIHLGKKEIFSRKPYCFKVLADTTRNEELRMKTESDPNLCVIAFDNTTVFYMKNGAIQERRSRLLVRQAGLLAEFPEYLL